ncbi:MAG: response regulator [Steroidobacteraceae bacterium]|nr:response regulator [Deltaproteobacteria bacterium]
MRQLPVRILCVDDDPHNLSLLEAMLSPRGYEVVLATNGPEALEKIRTERIDICLLDVMMPEMDGFEVCRRIKSEDRHRNIPVVMITIYADRENRIRGIEAGAEDFIAKPFDSTEVLARIKMLAHVKSLNDRLSEVILQQQAILDNIPNIAWLKDREGSYVAVNEPFSRALGLAPKDLVGKNDYDIYPPELAVKYDQDFRNVMATGTRTYFEESIVDPEGKIRYVEKIETPIFNDEGVVIGIIGIAHDITGRKEVEVSLRHDNTHDILTGLYNRAFYDEELERFARSRMFPVSIVMADVNGLKTVNDTLGHAAGDDLICSAARIILEAFRAEDIVARLGGDEFGVLLPGTAAAVAEEAVGRIMSSPEIVNGQVSIAFGIACAESRDQLTEALKLSDERMYLDKFSQKES